MGHIGDLFKKSEELQKQIDEIKEENKDLKDAYNQATGGGSTTTTTDDDTTKNDAPAPVMSKKPNCSMRLDKKQGEIVQRITDQLRKKGLSITQLLLWVEDKLSKDKKTTIDIRKVKTYTWP